MDEYHMSKILRDIAQKTYKHVPPFKLEIHVEERKTFHGDYYYPTATIRIFNMSRPADHIISTTIHELAHHMDYALNGSSGHNKRFYGILRDLMTTAIKCGYINYEIARKKCDSTDIMKMEHYYGPITASYDEAYDTHRNIRIVRVNKSFNIKDYLKENGFHYNGIEKLWEKEVDKEEVESLVKQVTNRDSSVEISIINFNEIPVETYYYVIVEKDTYKNKETLAKNGYKYKGYYIDKNAWVKKIKTTELNDEKRFLTTLGLSYQLKN